MEFTPVDMNSHRDLVCSVKDCNLPVDIALLSSDGLYFGAHTKNLENYSEGFPHTASVQIFSEIPVLEEEGSVIELMLRFMHNTRQPDLRELPIHVLAPLAEAVEKYMIYSAMEVCKIYMTRLVKKYPVDVLIYSVKHDYQQLANKAAPLTLSATPTMVVAMAQAAHLHDSFLLKWLGYREMSANRCRSILRNGPTPWPPRHGMCKLWEPFKKSVLLATIDIQFPKLKDVEDIIRKNIAMVATCPYCLAAGRAWQQHARTALAQFPAFYSV